MSEHNSKQSISKIKQLFNISTLKTIFAVVPSIIIFCLSYTNPVILSLGLIWRFVLPAFSISAVLFSGYSYFNDCFSELFHAFRQIIKNFSKSKAKFSLIKNYITKALNMGTLVSLSCFTSIIYAIVMGASAPLILYASPLFFLAALNFSALLRKNINMTDKEVEEKISRLKEEKYAYDGKNIKKDTEFNIYGNEIIPVDCLLLGNTGAWIEDRKVVSGEFCAKTFFESGSKLYAGTKYCGDEPIKVRALCNTAQSMHYTRISSILEKSKVQSQFNQKIDRISAYFIPVVLSIALLSLLIWTTLSGFSFGFCVMMDVFFAACPCTLGLAANFPYAILKKILFNNNIIIYEDSVIEKLPEFDTVVFDKTGTLTTLTYKRQEIVKSFAEANSLKLNQIIINAIVRAEEKRLVERPTDIFAKAIVEGKIIKRTNNDRIEIKTSVANGMEIVVSGKRDLNLYIGNANFLKQNGIDDIDESQIVRHNSDDVRVYIGLKNKGQVRGVLHSYLDFKQEPRHDAKDTIEQLAKQKVGVHMVTGDTDRAAKIIAKELVIPELNIQAQCVPEGVSKSAYIANLKAQNKKIIFVGDGWNDHEAAKVANVASIAMGKDSNMHGIFDITVENLADLLKLKETCRKTNSNQYKLFWFAIITNFASMLLAAVILPICGMVCMMGCFGVCMAGLSLVATFGASFLVTSINKVFKKDVATNEVVSQRIRQTTAPVPSQGPVSRVVRFNNVKEEEKEKVKGEEIELARPQDGRKRGCCGG